MEGKRRRVLKNHEDYVNFDLYADDSSSDVTTINIADTQSHIPETVNDENDFDDTQSIIPDSQTQLFSRDEFRIIVEMFFSNQEMLEGNFNESKGITKVKRKKKWQAITDAVNG